MKSLLFVAAPAFVAGGAYLLFQNSKEDYQEKKQKLLEILEELKAAYIPIYVHSYNLYVNSVNELRDKKGSEEFVKAQVQEQSKFILFDLSIYWKFSWWKDKQCWYWDMRKIQHNSRRACWTFGNIWKRARSQGDAKHYRGQ